MPYGSKKKLGIILSVFLLLSVSSIGFAYAQSTNSTDTSPQPTNSTSTNQSPTNSTDVGNFIPDQSSFIIDMWSNSTGTYISLLDGNVVQTHYGNGTAVPADVMGGAVVETEEQVEITEISHTTTLPDPVQGQPTPPVVDPPVITFEPHPNNPDGLAVRDLVNTRGVDTSTSEVKLPDGTIQGTFTTGLQPMLLDWVNEETGEVHVMPFKVSETGDTVTVSSPKTSYVYHKPSGAITLFSAGQVEGGSQPVAIESWTVHRALWGSDTWINMDLNNAQVITEITQTEDKIVISSIRTNDNGVFRIDYVLNALEELETFIHFTNNNPEWSGTAIPAPAPQLLSAAIPYIAGVDAIPAVQAVGCSNITNSTGTFCVGGSDGSPAVPAIPEQLAVPAVWSEPSAIVEGSPMKIGFVQSIDSITLDVVNLGIEIDTTSGFIEHQDLSNVLSFVDHLGIPVKYDFKDSKGELWAISVDENGNMDMDFRYAKGVVNYGQTKSIDPSWEWEATTSNSYYADAEGFGYSTNGVTFAPTRCPDGTNDGSLGGLDYSGQGRIATHPTTQESPSCSFEAIEWDVSGLPADAIITTKNIVFNIDMVSPPATAIGWTQSASSSGTVTPDYEEDFSDDYGWTLEGSHTIADGVLHMDGGSDAYTDLLSFDFGIDEDFIVLWDMKLGSGDGGDQATLLFGTTQDFGYRDASGSEDMLSLYILGNNNLMYGKAEHGGNSGELRIDGGSTAGIPPEDDTWYYYALKRVDYKFYANCWTDSDRTIEVDPTDFGMTDDGYCGTADGWSESGDFENQNSNGAWGDGTYTPIGSYLSVTGGSGSNLWLDNIKVYNGKTDLNFATSTGNKIIINPATATASYDNPTDVDWQRKALGLTADNTSFKLTSEIKVTALGDSAQVVVLQDDVDAPQDSTPTTTGVPDPSKDAENIGITRVTASGTNLPTTLQTATPYAYEYSGSGNPANDFNKVPFDFTGYDSFTMSLWLQPDEFAGNYIFRNQGSSAMELAFYGWGAFNTKFEWGGYTATTMLTVNEWVNLVIQKDDDTFRMFVDGVEVDTATHSSISGAKSGSGYSGGWWLFNWDHSTDEPFDGDALQMLVYDTALSQSDIDDIYNSGLGTNTPPTDDMVLWYNFQQATSGSLENQALLYTTIDVLDSEDSLALTIDSGGNAKVSARDPAVAPPSSLTTFPDSFGSSADDSANGSGVTLDTTNKLLGSGSMVWDGSSNAKMVVPVQMLPTDSDFTYSFWIKDLNSGSNQELIRDSYELNFSTNDNLYLNGVTISTASSYQNCSGCWHNIMVVKDYANSIEYVYWNYNEVTGSVSNYNIGSQTDWHIGGRSNGSEMMNGNMDEFVVWHRALSDSERATIYNGGSGNSPSSIDTTDLKLYYDMEAEPQTNIESAITPGGAIGDWADSSISTQLELDTDYWAEITRGNILAEDQVVDYNNPSSNPPTETYETDFSTSTGWTTGGTEYEIDTTAGVLETDESQGNTDNSGGRIHYDLQNDLGSGNYISTDKWLLQFDYVETVDDSALVPYDANDDFYTFITLTELEDWAHPNNQDSIGMVRNYAGASSDYNTGVNISDGDRIMDASNRHFAAEETDCSTKCYVTIIRDGDDVTIQVRETSHTATPIIDYTYGNDNLSTVENLRYITFVEWFTQIGTTYHYDVDNLKFYDGVSSLDDVITYPYFVDQDDVATLRIFDDSAMTSQVGTTVHLDVSEIKDLDNAFLAGAIPTETGGDYTVKDIAYYGAGTDANGITTYPTTASWQSEFDNALVNGRNCDVVALDVQPSTQTEYNALYTGIMDGTDVLFDNNDFCGADGTETLSIPLSYGATEDEDWFAIGIRHDGLGVELTAESSGYNDYIVNEPFDSDTNWTFSSASITGGEFISTGGGNSYKAYTIGTPDEFYWDWDWTISEHETPYINLNSDTTGSGNAGTSEKKLMVWLSANDKHYIGMRMHDGSTHEETQADTATTFTDWDVKYYYRLILDDTAGTWSFAYYSSDADRQAGTNAVASASESDCGGCYSNHANSYGIPPAYTSSNDFAYVNIGDWDGHSGDDKVDDVKIYTIVPTTPATYADKDSTHWHSDVEAELEISYTVPPPYLPNAPTGFSQDVSNLQAGQVSLEWTDPSEITEEIPVDRYNIYKSEFVYAKRQLADSQGTDPFLFNTCGPSGDQSCQLDMSDNTLLLHLNDQYITTSGTTTSPFSVDDLLAYYDFNEDATFVYDPLDFVQNTDSGLTESETILGQGNDGGNDDNSSNGHNGGGGGGSGAVGDDAIIANGGSNGGVGLQNDILGTNYYWAGGGAGSNSYYNGGDGGLGGAGGGASGNGNAGVGSAGYNTGSDGTGNSWYGSGGNAGDNTGSGGGGGMMDYGGAGGSGIVVVRYLTSEITANGGTETTDGIYTINTFTDEQATDTFIITSGSGNVEYMIIGGGGSGGAGQGAGGGGAGGYVVGTQSMTVGSSTVTVGAGGASQQYHSQGNDGSNSSLDSIIAYGGGRGGYNCYNGSTSLCDGGDGGSGGGAAGWTSNNDPSVTGDGGSGMPTEVVVTDIANPDAWITGIDGQAFDTSEFVSAEIAGDHCYDEATIRNGSVNGDIYASTVGSWDNYFRMDQTYSLSGFPIWEFKFDHPNYTLAGLTNNAFPPTSDMTSGTAFNSWQTPAFPYVIYSNTGDLYIYDYAGGGSATNINTSITGADTLKFELDSTSARFYVNDVLKHTFSTTPSGDDWYAMGQTEASSYSITNLSCVVTPAVIYDSNLTTTSSPVDYADDPFTVSAWTKQAEAGLLVSSDGWKFGQQTGLYGAVTSEAITFADSFGSSADDSASGSGVSLDTTNKLLGDGSLEWDGSSNAKVVVPVQMLPTSGDFTYSFWLYAPNHSSSAELIRDSYEMNFGASKNLYLNGVSLSTASSYNACTSCWHNIMVVKDSANSIEYIYWNYDEVTGSISNYNIGGQTDWHIGSRSNGSEALTGNIDDFAVWHRALTDVERATIYNDGLGNTPDKIDTTDLKLYYDFEAIPVLNNLGAPAVIETATVAGVELDGTFYPSDVESTNWVHHVLTKGDVDNVPTTNYYANGVLQETLTGITFGDETNAVVVSGSSVITVAEDYLDESTTQTSQLDEQAEKYGIKILTGSDLIGKDITSFSLNIGISGSPSGTVTSSIYRDGSSTPHETSTTTYNISQSGWSGTPVQVDFEYAGTTTLQADDRIVYECDGGTSSCHDGGNQIKFEVDAHQGSGFTDSTQIALYYSGVWQGYGGATSADALYKVAYESTGASIDAQIDDIVIFDEAISYFAVETLYDSGNHRPPSSLQAPSYASHWELDGTGTDAQKLATGVVNAQPPANPNTSTETVLKNQAGTVGAPLQSGQTAYSDFDGTRNGDTTAGVSGIDGFSYRFDGNDHVSLSNVIKGTGDFTVSTWIMPENLQTWEHWLSSYDSGSGTNWAFGLNNGQVFWYSESIATDYSTETLTEDTWNHIVVKRVDGNITFVIDGVPDNSVHDRTNVDYADSIMAIGGIVGASNQNFYGLVDETSFWDRALSNEEITILYNNKSLKNLPTVTIGTATTTVGIEDSSGLHEVGGQLQIGTGYYTSTLGDEANADHNEFGGTVGVECIVNNCWEYDGNDKTTHRQFQDDTPNRESLFHGTGDVSWSMWFKRTSASNSGNAVPISIEGTWDLHTWQPSSGKANIGRNYVQTSESIAVDTWYHVLATRADDQQYVYINGDLALGGDTPHGGASSSAQDYPANKEWLIGCGGWNSECWYGFIDEFTLWNKELSASDALALYNSGNGIELTNASFPEKTSILTHFDFEDTEVCSGSPSGCQSLKNKATSAGYELAVAGADFESGKLLNALVDPTLEITSTVLPSETDDFTIMGWYKQEPEARYSAEYSTTGSTGKVDAEWDASNCNSSYYTIADNKITKSGGGWSDYCLSTQSWSPSDNPIIYLKHDGGSSASKAIGFTWLDGSGNPAGQTAVDEQVMSHGGYWYSGGVKVYEYGTGWEYDNTGFTTNSDVLEIRMTVDGVTYYECDGDAENCALFHTSATAVDPNKTYYLVTTIHNSGSSFNAYYQYDETVTVPEVPYEPASDSMLYSYENAPTVTMAPPTPAYETTFATDPSWDVSSETGTNFWSAGKFNFKLQYSNTPRITYDLSPHLDGDYLQDQWITRLTVNPVDFGVYDSIAFMGFSDQSSSNMLTGNFLGIAWLMAYDRLYEIDGGSSNTAQNTWDSSTYLTDNEGTDYYLQITRDGSVVTRSYYTDDTYTTVRQDCDSGNACTSTYTFSDSHDDLKYFYMNHPALGGWSGSAYTQGEIKDFKLWDGTTSTADVPTYDTQHSAIQISDTETKMGITEDVTTITYTRDASFDGTAFGSGIVTGVTGKIGNAWDFDSPSGVEVNANLEPNSNDADTKWSLNVWINMDSTGTNTNSYLTAGNSYPDRIDFRYYASQNNQYTEHDYDMNIADNFGVDDTWYMLTNVRDGTDWCQYRDGALVGCVTGEDFTVTDKTTWWIGESQAQNGEGLNGTLDEMTMWADVSLTLADVQALCNDSGGCQGIAYTDANFPEKSSVVAHYDFEQTDTTLENQRADPTNVITKQVVTANALIDYTHADNSDEWHHVAYTRDGTDLEIYYDGVSVATETILSTEGLGVPDSVTPDVADVDENFSPTYTWIDNGATTGQDVSSGTLNWVTTRDSTWSNHISHDLGSTVSDTAWVLRFNLTIDSDYNNSMDAYGLNGGFALTEVPTGTGNAVTGYDWIGLQMRTGSSGQYNSAYWTHQGDEDKQYENDITQFSETISADDEFWVEIIRNSETEVITTFYSDSSYETVVESKTDTISGIENLRYLRAWTSGDDNLGSSVLNWKIDDLTFYDGISSVTSVGTDPVFHFGVDTDGNFAMDGSLDELATFDVALTADEINNAYLRGAETFALVASVDYDDADNLGEYVDQEIQVGDAPVYQIGAENLLGETMSETILPAITAVPPDAPTAVIAVAVPLQINVSWQAPAEDGGSAIIDYVVYRSDDYSTIIHTTTGTSWSGDTTGTIGTGYTYKVAARNIMGEGDLGTSNTEVMGNVPAQAIISLTTALAALAVRVDWTHQDDNGYGLTSYTVEWSSNAGSSWTSVGTTAGSATTITHSGLTEGTDYQYQIRATNALGDGAWSAISSPAVTAGDVPDAPTSVSSTANAGSSITTTWVEPDDHEYAIDKYEIFRDGTSIDNNVTGLTYTDPSLSDATTYVYKVRAHNQLGWSVDSATDSAVAGDIPDQVTGQTATADVDYDVDLAWSAATDNGHAITNYLIEHSADGSTNWTTKATVGNVLTYHAEYDSAESGNTKYWRISAINDLGTGAVSANASVKIGDVPSQVTVTATAQSATEIDLAWNTPSDNGYAITVYKVERSTTGVFGGEETVLTSTHTITTYDDTGLTTSTDYYYRVSATNALGEGAYSSTVQEKTFGIPSDIDDLALTVISTSQINLAWTEPALNGYTLVEYEIFVSEDNVSWTSLATQTGISYSSTGLNANDLYYYKVTTKNGFGTSGDSNIENDPTLPTPPATITLTVNSATEILVQWNQPAGDQQTSYKIEISTDGTNWSDEVASTGNTNVSYTDTGLTTLTTYYYRISTINPSGTSVASTASSAETWGVPDAPTSLTAIAVLNVDIDLDWDAPSDTHGQPITGYKIERGTTNTSFSVIVADTASTDTDYTDDDTNLVAGTEYFYRVSAINSQGSGDPSNIESATAADVPAVVTGLAITSTATDSVDLDWTAPSANGSPIIGYFIEKSTDGVTYTTLVADTQSTAVTFNDDDGGNGLNVNTLYYYKVSAINAFGTGSSDSANGPTLPQAPATLTVTTQTLAQESNQGAIKLDWTDPSGDAESGFKIESSLTGNSGWTDVIADTGNTDLTYVDDGLTANTEYFYRVSTINLSGESSPTSVVSDTTFGPTDKPLNLTATSLIGAEIQLDWTAPTNNNGDAPNGYKIERSTDGTNYSVLVADTGSVAVTYTDGVTNSLTTGTTYYYIISAINDYGTSGPSTAANAIASDVPSQVTNLTADAVAGKVIDLVWTAPNNGGSAITGYKIERSTTSAVAGFTDLVADTQSVAVSYSDINLTVGTTYYYKISAINLVGTGTASTVANDLAGDKPDQITVITATAVIGEEVDLTWTAPTDNSYAISSYAVEFSLDGSTNWQSAGSNTVNSFTHSSLTEGTTYYYRVSATNALGTSTFSGVVNALAGDAPDQVAGLATTVLDDTKIRLNWTTPDDNSYTISGYKIEQSPDGSTNWTDVVSDTQSTTLIYTVTSLQPKTDYYFRVSAINSLGIGSVSTAVIGTTFDVPEPVADLAGTASASAIVLTWSAPDDNGSAVQAYQLQVESFSNPGTWHTISSNIQTTTYTHSSIVDNLQYKFRLFATNTIGQSTASNTAIVWTLPTAPVGVTATAVSGTEIDVAWTSGTGITYKIEHSTDNVTFSTEADPATTPYTDSGLTIDTIHYYKVYAINPSGTSPASIVVSATTFDYPSQPLNLILTPTVTNLLEITLNWTVPSDLGGTPLTNYYVERSVDNIIWGALATIAPSTTSHVDTTLTIGTTYYYRVIAENVVGKDGTNGYSATVEYQSPTLSGSASSVTAEPYGTQNSQIRVDWVAPANYGSHPVIGYLIERNVDSAGWAVLDADTQSATTYYTNSGLSTGVEYAYRVYPITAACAEPLVCGIQASNIDQATLVNAQVSIVANVVGGNTIEIIPSVDLSVASPDAELKLINLYMNGNFVSSQSGSTTALPPGVTPFSSMFAYPTEQAEFYVIMVLTQNDANNHQASLTSSTTSATPSDPFTGDLDWREFRVLDGSSVPSEQDYTQSNLELDIQPVGSDVIVKYTPQDPLLSPIVLGFNNVQQALDEVIDTNAASDYYVGVYIDPKFSDYYTTDPVTHVVSVDCNAFGNDYQSLGLTCQEDDIPLGYKSDIAFRSLKDPTSPTQLGIEGMGDLFGMPMVMLFIIGIAAVFTGRSAQMGGIILVALIGVMVYLGYLELMWESTTWVLLIIIVVLGIFIGKRWS